MTGLLRTNCAFALVIALSLSGCGSRDPPSEVTSFVASVEANGRTVRLLFDGPFEIADRDFETRRAYRFVVGDTEQASTFFLDAAFRVVRIDSPCSGSNDCENYVSTEYFSQGRPAPFGLGLLQHQDMLGALMDVSSREPKPIHVEGRGNRLSLTEGLPGLPAGDYQYPNGRLLPNGPLGRVTAYETGEDLADADLFPMSAERQVRAGLTGMFPGGEQDLFETGFAPSKLFEGLKRERPEVAIDLQSGGCLVRIDIDPIRYVPTNILDNGSARAIFDVAAPAKGVTRYEVKATRDLFGREEYSVVEEPRTLQRDCSAILRSPAPGMPVQEIIQRMEKINLSHAGLLGFEWTIADLSDITGRPPEQCYGRFISFYKPSHVPQEGIQNYQAHHIDLDSCNGWVESILRSRSDVEPSNQL